MKKLFFIVLLFIITSVFVALSLSKCQAQITFQKTYGGTSDDWGYSVQQTADGGYIITGQNYGFGAGNTDVYLIKIYSNGDTLWAKTFGGTYHDGGTSIQQTTDGGYIITGFTYSFGAGTIDVYLIKTDLNGNSLWAKTFGGTDYDYCFAVDQTADGGYVIAGTTKSFGAGTDNAYLIRTDANGNSLWMKTYEVGALGYSVKQTTDGGFVVTGAGGFGAGNWDACLIKTDSTGDTLWTKTYGGTDYDYCFAVNQTADGGYVIAGGTKSFGAGDFDIYLT